MELICTFVQLILSILFYCHVLGNIYQNEKVENTELGIKVNMCKEISIRMRRWRI